jgi:acyl carrier protein
MTKAEFIEELELVLNEEEGSISESTIIEDIPGWDSTGLLGVIALLDGELDVSANVDKLRECVTIGDLITLTDGKLD